MAGKTTILIQTKAKYNLGPLVAENQLGSVTALTDNLVAPAANTGKWYYVNGVSGPMSGTNPPADNVVDNGYILSDGAQWNVFPQMPSVIATGGVREHMLSAAVTSKLTNGADFVDLGVANPEGVTAAPVGTFGNGSDGSLWYKATGGATTAGWSQLTASFIFDGGAL